MCVCARVCVYVCVCVCVCVFVCVSVGYAAQSAISLSLAGSYTVQVRQMILMKKRS